MVALGRTNHAFAYGWSNHGHVKIRSYIGSMILSLSLFMKTALFRRREWESHRPVPSANKVVMPAEIDAKDSSFYAAAAAPFLSFLPSLPPRVYVDLV